MAVDRCSSARSSIICACTVTSSAVVGSSAMSSAGEIRAMAIIDTLPHAAGKLVRIFVVTLSGAGIPTAASASIAWARAHGGRAPDGRARSR